MTMRALHNMDFDFDITTYTNPDLVRLENVYGSNLVSIITGLQVVDGCLMMRMMRIIKST